MENPIKTIQEKVNGMKGRLRDRLDSLPPRVRLKVVLVMFGLFALCSLYMIGSAIINFGNGKTSNIEVEHIESVKATEGKQAEHDKHDFQSHPWRKGIQPVTQSSLHTIHLFLDCLNWIFHSCYFYRSTVLMSLFSTMVKPSMVKPFGLSSERVAFTNLHTVTRLLSVTLLSRSITCRA